jgi:serine/threonine-protein kinase RsbW
VSSIVHDLAAHLTRDGLRPDMVEDATIALAEVLNNIEEHAYEGRPGCPVVIEIRADPSRFECRVEDHGNPLPGGAIPVGKMPPTDPKAPEKLPEGGFGWALLHRVTTELTYHRIGGLNRLFFIIS